MQRAGTLRRATLVLAGALLASAPACKRRPSYDTSTPDATLASFVKAVDRGDIPRDIEHLVTDETEQRRWRVRCQPHRCRKATIQVVDRGQESTYKAVLYADYEILGDAEVRVVWGKRTPIYLAREGGSWFIVQFGDEMLIPPAAHPPGGPDAAPPRTVEDRADAGDP